MKKLLCTVLIIWFHICTVYASEGGDEYKGSHSKYDATAEMVIIKKIESQTDPETEKVILGGMALKFNYLNNNFIQIDGNQVASVYFSDNGDEYVFDYYIDGDQVVKIVLYSKNGGEINKLVYPEDKGSGPEKKPQP